MRRFIAQLSGLRQLKPPWPPWLISLIGLGLIALGVSFLVMFGTVQVLTCVDDGDVGITCCRELLLWGILPLKRECVANITQATLELSCRTSARFAVTTCAYDTLTLHPAKGEPVALPTTYYNLPSVREAAATLQDYLDQPQPKPFIRHDVNTFTACMGSLCVVPPFVIWGVLTLIYWRKDAVIDNS